MKHRLFSHGHFVVKKGIQGVGVFANSEFKRGTILFTMHGQILDHPTRTSIQVGKKEHIEDVIGGHINHSCHPNAKVAKRSKKFISLRNIHKGEEITFNYNKNEDTLASPFKCACCGKKICGRTKKFSKRKNGIHN